jgi:hypothetical protein
MDVKTAISTAKHYVQDVYADENVTDLGLEEVQYDDGLGQWKEVLESLGGVSALKRSYKVITVANDCTVVAMKNRAKEDLVE